MILLSFATSMSVHPRRCYVNVSPHSMGAAPEESRTRARTTHWEHFQAQWEDQVCNEMNWHWKIWLSERKKQKLNDGYGVVWSCFFQHLSAITIASSIFGGKNESVCFDIFVIICQYYYVYLLHSRRTIFGFSWYWLLSDRTIKNQNGYFHALLR